MTGRAARGSWGSDEQHVVQRSPRTATGLLGRSKMSDGGIDCNFSKNFF